MKLPIWCTLALVSYGVSMGEDAGVYVLKNAKIVPGNGAVIDRGAVLIRSGLIEAVGANVTAPVEAWVVDCTGLTIYPGWIDALSGWGLPEAAPTPPPVVTVVPTRGRNAPSAAPAVPIVRGPEDRPATTSWLHAADLISVTDTRIAQARAAGFTTAVVFPKTGIFAGQGAVVNLAGDKPGKMVVASPVAQYVALATGGFTMFPGSIMGTLAYIRQLYLDAEHYQMEKAAYDGHAAGRKRPNYDRALEGLLESKRVLLPATRAYQIDRMARFAHELKLDAVLYGAHEGYAAVDVLRQANVPVLVSLNWPARPRDGDPEAHDSLRTLELRERAPSTPAALQRAGVRFAFSSDGVAPADVRRAVKRAIDAGLAEADATRALSFTAAQIYGVADRLGSIEPGKIANLVVTQGSFFDPAVKVKYVFVDGAKFEPVEESAPPENRSGEGRPQGRPTERPR